MSSLIRRSWFVIHGTRHWVWRNVKGQIAKWGWKRPEWIEPLETWRLTLGFNQLSISNKGHSFTLTAWSSDKRSLELRERELTLELKAYIEKEIGYPEEDWWGGITAKTDLTANVGYDTERFNPAREGKVEFHKT